MSLSVDDLVSSFSSSHIGQEAIDLAALHVSLSPSLSPSPSPTPPQAQLAQTLFASNPRQIPSRNTHTCNTPIARTPSASFSSAMDEDERMVEELLMPSSPAAPLSFPQGASQLPASPAHSQAHNLSYFPEPPPSSASVFASTDPFYLAAMQQQQQQQPPTSFLAQSGRLGQSSPFFVRQASTQHRDTNHIPLTIDTSHAILASAAY